MPAGEISGVVSMCSSNNSLVLLASGGQPFQDAPVASAVSEAVNSACAA